MADIDFIGLLLNPSENPGYEYKTWLDIERKPEMAKLAKAAIAIANHGGGYIILGMFSDPNKSLTSVSRHPAIRRYSSDAIARAINRFAEPNVDFQLHYAIHPATGVEHVIVQVEASRVPMMSTREEGKDIALHTFYIRKPGPKSEEPRTAEEWRTLINRCVRTERESMIEAIRGILVGVGAAPPQIDRLKEFEDRATERWNELVANRPAGDEARMPKGSYTIACEITGVAQTLSLNSVQSLVKETRNEHSHEWIPFRETHRYATAPHAYQDVLECWNVEDGGQMMRAAFSEFWWADPRGFLFQKQGYAEDYGEAQPMLNAQVQIKVLAELLMFIGSYAKQIAGKDTDVSISLAFTGLTHRHLTLGSRYEPVAALPFIQRVAVDDTAASRLAVSTTEIRENLPEVIRPLLVPLFERFNLFELKPDRIITALAELPAR